MADAMPFADGEGSPYPLLFEAVPEAIIVVDRRGTILMANARAAELFGWTRSELIGTKVERLIPGRFVRSHWQHLRRYGGNPVRRTMGGEPEIFGLRRDGTEVPLEIALSPLPADSGAMVVASIRDLTHTLRFRADAKRAQYAAELVRLGELAMRTTNIDDLLGAVPEFVARTLRADIAVLYWAAPGAPPHPRVIHGIPEELAGDAGVAAAILADGAEDEPTAKPRIVNDYRHGHETGPALVHVLDVASGLRVPLIGRKGLLGLLVTHARNVGRFGEEELHFMQAVGNLIVEALMRGDVEAQLAHAQRLESIGQLTGGIAHDFNNILTVVLGNLQMLHETLEESGGDRYIKLVESAQRAARRGADLTHKLLTFSRKQSLAPGGIDPAAALSALAEMLQRTIGDSIVIETVVAPGCPLFRADGPQFDNAVVNLALNARDAMPEGGHLRLTAAMVQVAPGLPDVGTELSPGSYVVIGVADTGQGMSPEVLRRACEPFFTTKASDKGSGLGLSMVYGFAKQSGGAIRIRSAPGQGTEVGLFFPVAAEAGAGASERPPGAGGPGKPTRQATILVVDDDVEVLGVATGFLEKAGYRVLQATDSAGARRWLTSQEPIAMLFTDVVLGPHETGPGLAAEAEQIRPGLPVLFTSGFAQGALGIVQMKPAQFLAKPYQHDQLAARIAALLAQADGEPAQPPAPARPNTLHLPTGHL